MVMVGYSLLDYCCVEQLPQSGEETPKYIVFMEVGGKEVTPSVSLVNQLAEELDKQLQSSYIYKSFRDKGSIAQVKVHLVKPMTFSKFRRTLILSEKATPNQFKVPRVIRKSEAIDFMHQNLVIQP
ncbi:GHDC [Bugula neritina]|uniref:GHDC n=1 Tax=Bugula neritina TaxID=10212 RepID=A0A7J7J5P2_BUGNE|nr:GHDC [Bugula neritina]